MMVSTVAPISGLAIDGPRHTPERGMVTGVSTQRDLVPVFSILVDAQQADMTHMVMPAGIHAAGNIYFYITDTIQAIKRLETPGDILRHIDRGGISQRAKIQAGTADDIVGSADIWIGETQPEQRLPQGEQPGLLYLRKDQVLRIGGADFTHAVAIGQIGHPFHLFVTDITRRLAVFFSER